MLLDHRLKVVLVLVAAVVGLAGCSGGSGESAGSTVVTATTAPAPTTTDPPTDEEAILAAVDGYWRTVQEAGNPPDPDHPGFDRYFTGEAKQNSLKLVSDRKAFGLVVRRPDNSVSRHNMTVMSIDGDRAHVRDCAVDDLVIFDTTMDRIVNDDVATALWQTSLDRVDGEWKVSFNTIIEKWEGVVECDS